MRAKGPLAVVTWLLLLGVLSQVLSCESRRSTTSQPNHRPVAAAGDARRRLSPDLLQILVDPGDKGSLDYTVDTDGNEWLVNPRNGYRYPVDDGVPVMLLDEGAKHRLSGHASH